MISLDGHARIMKEERIPRIILDWSPKERLRKVRKCMTPKNAIEESLKVQNLCDVIALDIKKWGKNLNNTFIDREISLLSGNSCRNKLTQYNS